MSDENGAHASASTLNNRKDSRATVQISAELLVSQGGRFKVAVHDLSASGFRMATANHIPTGKIVYLTLPGLQSQQARVAWNHHEMYGCEFTRRLHGSICDYLSNRFPSVFN